MIRNSLLGGVFFLVIHLYHGRVRNKMLHLDRTMNLTICKIIWLCWLLADMSVYAKDFSPNNKSIIRIVCNSVFMSKPTILKQIVILVVIIFNLALYLYHLFLRLYRLQINLSCHTPFYAFVFYLKTFNAFSCNIVSLRRM